MKNIILLLCFMPQWLCGQTDLTNSGVKVGENVPDTVGMEIFARDGETVNIRELYGKLVILDFWATWCAPCIAALPKLHAIQDRFEGKIQIIPTTYQDSAAIAEVINNFSQQINQSDLLFVHSDATYRSLFPHRTLPHCVWISPTGVLLAITDGDQVTEENVQKVLEVLEKGETK